MGCDIHAMIERRTFDAYPEEGKRPVWEEIWENAGDPNIGRDYTVFAVLGNVKNVCAIPYSEGKVTEEHSATGNTTQPSEQAGERTIFEMWGSATWDELIATVEAARKPYLTDEDVRICFWFDN